MRLLIAFVFLMPFITRGQDVTLQYFNQDGYAIASKENSHFYKIGKRMLFLDTSAGRLDTIESYVDTVTSYYTASDVIRSREIYNSDGILHGLFLTYHDNGMPWIKTTFFEGRPIGFLMSWYTNGKPQKAVQFHKESGRFSAWPANDFKIINYWDAAGTKTVDNGEGFCDCYFEGDHFHEKGKVKAGLRDSLWQGYSGDTLKFEEQYTNGELIKGERIDHGRRQVYYSFNSSPEYRSGMEGMMAFIRRNTKYPAEAQKKNIQGSVFIQFVVELDGTLTGFEVVQGVDPDLDKEALRIVKVMPPWTPALQRGQPVRRKHVVPVKFSL